MVECVGPEGGINYSFGFKDLYALAEERLIFTEVVNITKPETRFCLVRNIFVLHEL